MMKNINHNRRFVLFALALVCALLPRAAWADSPAHTETLQAGPYIVNVNLYQDPPMTDQSVEMTVVPQDTHLHLTGGSISTIPGLGTDAVTLRSRLTALDASGTLVGSIRMPVRGAWTVLVQLAGPQGPGQASFPITVAAPGAIPIWLGWLIGLLPMLGVAGLIWHQFRYRRRLLARNNS